MSNTQQNYIVGIGEALWDMLPEGRKIGGAPANFTFHVSQFGLDAVAVSAVGDDALGKEIRQTFDQKDLQTLLATPSQMSYCGMPFSSSVTSTVPVG